MAAINFITALGRLLRDGALRDLLASNRSSAALRLNLRPEDQPVFDQLNADELEFQAGVLLRKRLSQVRRWIPETCRRSSEGAWPAFRDYGRCYWPDDAGMVGDALQFCCHLKRTDPGSVAAVEWNRLRFLTGKRWCAADWVTRPSRRTWLGVSLQLLLRTRGGGWRELLFSVGL